MTMVRVYIEMHGKMSWYTGYIGCVLVGSLYPIQFQFQFPSTQSTRRPQNLISADVSKNVLSVHSTFKVTVCWPSYSQVKVSRLAV